MRKAKTNSRNRPKPSRETELTIRELRSLLEPYRDEETVNVVFRDEANHQTLKKWYRSLDDKFRNPRTRPTSRNTEAITSIEHSGLKLNDLIPDRFTLWDSDPELFWQLEDEFHVEHEALHSSNAYRKSFTIAAIRLRDRLSSYKLLWRFTTAAVYLHFRRWRPEIRYVRIAHVEDFLMFLGSDPADGSSTQALFTIIKAGQRRITFCEKLANLASRCDNDGASNTTNTDQLFRNALGVFFFDNIPDDIWDTNNGLFPKDNSVIIEHLLSIDIMKTPEEYDIFRLAKKLLDHQSSKFWPNESERQSFLEQSQGAFGSPRPVPSRCNAQQCPAAAADETEGDGSSVLEAAGQTRTQSAEETTECSDNSEASNADLASLQAEPTSAEDLCQAPNLIPATTDESGICHPQTEKALEVPSRLPRFDPIRDSASPYHSEDLVFNNDDNNTPMAGPLSRQSHANLQPSLVTFDQFALENTTAQTELFVGRLSPCGSTYQAYPSSQAPGQPQPARVVQNLSREATSLSLADPAPGASVQMNMMPDASAHDQLLSCQSVRGLDALASAASQACPSHHDGGSGYSGSAISPQFPMATSEMPIPIRGSETILADPGREIAIFGETDRYEAPPSPALAAGNRHLPVLDSPSDEVASDVPPIRTNRRPHAAGQKRPAESEGSEHRLSRRRHNLPTMDVEHEQNTDLHPPVPEYTHPNNSPWELGASGEHQSDRTLAIEETPGLGVFATASSRTAYNDTRDNDECNVSNDFSGLISGESVHFANTQGPPPAGKDGTNIASGVDSQIWNFNLNDPTLEDPQYWRASFDHMTNEDMQSLVTIFCSDRSPGDKTPNAGR